MNKKIIFSIMLVLLLAFVTVWAFAQNSPSIHWEYMLVNRRQMSQQQANKLGAEGWELVTYGMVGGGDTPAWDTFIFKRRLP
jgi:hypothetical protein